MTAATVNVIPPRREHHRAVPATLVPTDQAEIQISAVHVERLLDYRAGVVRCEQDGVASAITEILRRHAARDVLLPAGYPER